MLDVKVRLAPLKRRLDDSSATIFLSAVVLFSISPNWIDRMVATGESSTLATTNAVKGVCPEPMPIEPTKPNASPSEALVRLNLTAAGAPPNGAM